jgi:hypothetical protein
VKVLAQSLGISYIQFSTRLTIHTIIIDRDESHDQHVCEKRTTCPYICQLCKRLCATPDHLHGLDPSEKHLCGYVYFRDYGPLLLKLSFRSSQEHRCQAVCATTGICEIDTQPQSIDAIFTGRHETFQYTKVTVIQSNGKRCSADHLS